MAAALPLLKKKRVKGAAPSPKIILTSTFPPLVHGGRASNRGHLMQNVLRDLQDAPVMDDVGYELARTFFFTHARRRSPYTALPLVHGFKTAARPSVPSLLASKCPQCKGAPLSICELCYVARVLFSICGAVVGCPDICYAPA